MKARDASPLSALRGRATHGESVPNSCLREPLARGGSGDSSGCCWPYGTQNDEGYRRFPVDL